MKKRLGSHAGKTSFPRRYVLALITATLLTMLAVFMLPTLSVVPGSVNITESIPEAVETIQAPLPDGDAGDVVRGLLLDNADHSLVGDGDNLTGAGYTLTVKYSIADASMANEEDSINTLLYDENKIGAVMGQYDTEQEFFSVSPDANYYMAFVDVTKINSAGKAGTYAFAYNVPYGNIIEDAIYDKDHGIAYVPVKYFSDDASPVQMQVVVIVDFEASMDPVLRVDGGGVVNVPENIAIDESKFDVTTSIQIADEKTSDKISLDNIEVKINGQDEPLTVA